MRFSIITPSFNQLDWLRLCVASVRDQVTATQIGGMLDATYESKIHNPESIIPSLAVEHIIQDAGTPDIEVFAREVGADFYKEGNLVFRSQVSNFSISRYRIAIYCEPDSGMYDAINRGVARATGEICAYLNCDEQYLCDALSAAASTFLRIPTMEVLFCGTIILDKDFKYVCSRLPVKPWLWHTEVCHLSTFTCSTFFKKTVFTNRKLKFPEEAIGVGDGLWIVSLIRADVQMKAFPFLTSAFSDTGTNLALSERHAQEVARERAKISWLKLAFAPLLAFLHRARKAWHGEYTQKPFTFKIYTKHCLEKRFTQHVTAPTGVWKSRLKT